MSVIVKGMEMPECCAGCFAISDNLGWCKASGNDIYSPFSMDGRPSFCPLRPMPEKHGRLIDRKELEKAILKWLPPDPCGREEMEYPFETDICVSMMMEIGDQETIVEAEGEI